MLAYKIPLAIHYLPIPTLISALVAILSTWLTFGYEFLQLFYYRRRASNRRREVRLQGKKRRGEERALMRRDRAAGEGKGRVKKEGTGNSPGGNPSQGGTVSERPTRPHRHVRLEEPRGSSFSPGPSTPSHEENTPNLLPGTPMRNTVEGPTINVTLDPTADLNVEEDEEEEEEEDDIEHDEVADEATGVNERGYEDQSTTSRPYSLNQGGLHVPNVSSSRLPGSAFKPTLGWQSSDRDGMISPHSLDPGTGGQPSQPQTVPTRRNWAGFNPSDEDLSTPNRTNPLGRRPTAGPSIIRMDYINSNPIDPSHSPSPSPSVSTPGTSGRTGSLAFSDASTESLPSFGSSARGFRMDSSGSITSRGSTSGGSLTKDAGITDAAVQAYAGGTMSLRLRQLKDTNGGAFGWREVLDDWKSGWNRKVMIKGVMLGSSAFSMHYQGMASMRMGDEAVGFRGGVEWNWTWIAFSWIIACIASIVAIVFSEYSKDT
jgi:hypothetical protein